MPDPFVERERDQIVTAMIDLVLENGYRATTLEMILKRSGVTRVSFECHFSDPEDCFLQIYSATAQQFDQAVMDAYRSHCEWRDGLRAVAYATARFVRDNPREVSFGMVGDAGDLAQAYREATIERQVDLVDAGRQQLDDPDSVTRSTAQTVAGMAYETILKGLHEQGGVLDLEAMVPELMYIAVLPYLGPEVAAEELEIAPPPE